MTAPDAHAAAVQIVYHALFISDERDAHTAVVDALARAGLLCPPGTADRLAALEQVAEAAWIYSESTRNRAYGNPNQTWRDMNDALADVRCSPDTVRRSPSGSSE